MSTLYNVRKDEYLISTDSSLLNKGVIHHYLSQDSYWAKNMPMETLEKAISNSTCFGVYYNDQQIGFARVITDKATFAYLADVFILEQFRGKGLSKWLMETIHAHPGLQNFRRWVLATRDAHGLYEQFGWTNLDDTAKKRFMQKLNDKVYQ